MKTIEEIRAEDTRRREAARVQRENGRPLDIMCPAPGCGLELRYFGGVNLSNPPTIWASCENEHKVVLPKWVAEEGK
jgi:hypothetical protein